MIFFLEISAQNLGEILQKKTFFLEISVQNIGEITQKLTVSENCTHIFKGATWGNLKDFPNILKWDIPQFPK